MYNTNIKLTYKNIVDEDESENMYRKELLDVFHMNVFDDKQITNHILELFKIVSPHKELREYMTNMAYSVISEEDEVGFILMFSYDCFHLVHPCICDFFENKGEISQENIKALSSSIK